MTVLSKALPIMLVATAPSYALTFDQLSAQYINNGQLSEQIQVIDCRASNHYNGWPSSNSTLQGHFPGAYNIDHQWLNRLDPQQFKQLLADKQLSPNKPTFVYGDDDTNTPCETLTTALNNQGFTDVNIITQSLAQASEPLVTLANFKQLVSAQWIEALINGHAPAYSPQNNYKIVEVQWGPGIHYLASHIPGALNLDTNDLEAEPWWNRVNDQQIATVLSNLGIRYDTTVILYGRNNMAAARAANIMMYAGVEDVRLLNGGWQAWLDAGFTSESFSNSNEQAVEFGKTIPANPQYIIDIPEAKSLLAKDPQQNSLVSIRTWDEFTGKITGYSYIKEKGRIAGAKWGHAGTDANNVSEFLNPDGTMKSERAIKQLWKEANIHADQQVAFYCGTGWRASEVFFYAHVMGWQNISVFDGGWYQWSGNKANPTINDSE